MNNICQAVLMMLRSTFLALLLAFSAFASSPEHLVGTAEPAVASSIRFNPASASNGTDYFVAWSDQRTGTGSIYGTRVSATGQVLDPLGVRIFVATGHTAAAQVVWDGEAYLVAWEASNRADYTYDVYIARVSVDGEVVLPPRAIAHRASLDTGRYLASNGSTNVLIYTDNDGIRVASFDRNVTTLTTRPLPTPGNVREPSVVAGTSGFVATWNSNVHYSTDTDVIEAVRLDATGNVAGLPKTIGLGDSPSVATSGSRYTIAWRRNDHWDSWALRSRTFDANLEPVGEDATHFTIPRMVSHVDTLWVNGHFEILAIRDVTGGVSKVVSVEVSANGVAQPVRERNELIQEMSFLGFSPATNGTDIYVARAVQSYGYSALQIFGDLYRNDSTLPAPPALLSWSGNAHHDPQIASGPAGYFVAWVEDSGAYATRVDHIGRSLDGRGIRLTNSTYATTSVAFDGTNWVVAWREFNGVIQVRFLSPADGSTVAQSTIQPEAGYWPKLTLATAPDATFLVFADSRIRVVRIPTATHVADPVPLTVSPEDIPVDHPVASWNGSELLVVWTQEYLGSRGDPPLVYSVHVWGARVTPNLTLLDPAPLHIAASEGTEEEGYSASYSAPSVATNGQDWLVVTGINGIDVLGRRVFANGTLSGNEPTTIARGVAPVVTFDGTRYAIAWKEGDFWLDLTVTLNAVPSEGELRLTSRTIVARDTAASPVTIAPAANAAAAVAYTRVSFLTDHAGVERSFFRVMDYSAPPRGRAIRR